ncbi:hypothetical protein [Legionella impletisoli]|uniref:Uncharacterized protein n=1 Tax=Legionella impletisoli TaxID=343510 RepID=A0A917JWS5_9GAMM|nr:hypothetical protein [Legionella impletisoli]GGI87802.1 hypothetical protein GCM10007966_15680 [Legionella impletisoli]
MSTELSNLNDTGKQSSCGICRAMGLPICKGHAGGGSGSDSENKAEKQESSKPENQPNIVQLNALSSSLEKNADWQSNDDFKFSFNGFNQNASLASIELDLAKCILKLEPKKNLDSEQKKDLQVLFDNIKVEVNQRDGAVARVSNEVLVVNHSDPKQFDALISNLMSKNLMPTDKTVMQVNLETQSIAKESSKEEVDNNWAPNPFDVSKGPTPSDK